MTLIHGHFETAESVFERAAGEPDLESSLGQVIGERDFARETQRMMNRQRNYRGPDPRAFGHRGHPHRQHQRARHHQSFLEVMLRNREGIKTDFLGELCLLEHLGVDPRIRRQGIAMIAGQVKT